jgi:hypothetical protein
MLTTDTTLALIDYVCSLADETFVLVAREFERPFRLLFHNKPNVTVIGCIKEVDIS